MKIFTLKIVAFFLSLSACIAASEDAPQLAKFYSEKRNWDGELNKINKKEGGSLSEAINAYKSMLNAWDSVPNSTKKIRYDALNRTAFTMAELSAKNGKYEQALKYLDDEMQFHYQYVPGGLIFLSGQNRSFYQSVIELEAKILGHLGRDHYLNSIDCYLMPVGKPKNGKLDLFVAMEETSDDEYGFVIPPLPEGQNRKIFRLLIPDGSGNYKIADSVQLIGFVGKKIKISLLSNENSNSILSITGITHIVKMKHGIPFEYIPISTDIIKLNVSPSGFQKLN